MSDNAKTTEKKAEYSNAKKAKYYRAKADDALKADKEGSASWYLRKAASFRKQG